MAEHYAAPTPDQIARFRAHGYLAMPHAYAPEDVEDLARRCLPIREEPEQYANVYQDSRESDGSDQVLQSMLELVWLDWQTARFHTWTLEVAAALMGQPVRLWYNQLLDKPPLRGAPTHWHQDGAMLEGDAAHRLVSCWTPLQDVDVDSGCMHFMDRGHLEGVLPHEELNDTVCGRGPCIVDPERVVACPLPRGGVTFHHGLMPHMTRPNRSDRWRQVLIQRFFVGRPPGSAS